MVDLKYSALYTDNLGCEQSTICFSKGEFQLKVRGCTFKSDSFNFDFYAKNYKKISHIFYLKDDELIEYVLDIKIPLTLVCHKNECIEEFLLRVERHKNYYRNSLSVCLAGVVYKVHGYDLQELIINMKKELPKEYNIESYFSYMFGVNYIETSNCKKEFNKRQTVPITYICDKYCLS